MSVITNTPPVFISKSNLDDWIKSKASEDTTRVTNNLVIGNIFSRIWNLFTGNLSAIKVVSDTYPSMIALVYVRKDALASLIHQTPQNRSDFKALVKNAVADIALKGKTILEGTRKTRVQYYS